MSALHQGFTSPAEPELASWIHVLDDGIWRVCWRGVPIQRSFPSRAAALQHLDSCEKVGEALQ